jgi:Sec-independent protein translocase protein TatA
MVRSASGLGVGSEYHPLMGETLAVLLVVLLVVFVWRGPKTLPKIGQALGRSVKDVRRELNTADPEKPETPDQT